MIRFVPEGQALEIPVAGAIGALASTLAASRNAFVTLQYVSQVRTKSVERVVDYVLVVSVLCRPRSSWKVCLCRPL